MRMQSALARELEAFQHEILHLTRAQDALAARDETLRADFAVITARCDTLIGQWSAATAGDSANTDGTVAQQRRELARELHAHCTKMARAIQSRRAVEAEGNALYVQWFNLERRVHRLRQSLDRELFGAVRLRPDAPEETEPLDDIDAMTLLLHEMRTHLTMALLAADRLSRAPHGARTARFTDYLMTGLALLQRDLDTLDPAPNGAP
jgi:hypothetical protein